MNTPRKIILIRLRCLSKAIETQDARYTLAASALERKYIELSLAQ